MSVLALRASEITRIARLVARDVLMDRLTDRSTSGNAVLDREDREESDISPQRGGFRGNSLSGAGVTAWLPPYESGKSLVGTGARAVAQPPARSAEFEVRRMLASDIDAAHPVSFSRRAGFSGLRVPMGRTSNTGAGRDHGVPMPTCAPVPTSL
ncbi:hypothetical protein KN815_27620 [Streptomyces sp. 4503]|uniref:Uncharacterized protein n=1 Tax=Streptomyces niphimycinicus TaxID=2842201 RepID=A0ABS6CLN8_9ACTN|nr:hypothetical protein [Streptomyces niphimycinicus]MBU3867691.1 hypothetical protein [Streptomyces niphimycinicus]